MKFTPIQISQTSTDYIKGLNSKIPYVVMLGTGDWRTLGNETEPQKFKFDTDECTTLSAIKCVQTKCNLLKSLGNFPPEALDFFAKNSYYDANEKFAFSEMFSGICAGTSINGNDPIKTWDSFKHDGFLPRSKLSYTLAQSQQWSTQEDQDTDYYNPAHITQAMRDLAEQSLKYLSVQYEYIGKQYTTPDMLDLKATLLQSPLQVVVPVPDDVDVWNSGLVKYDGKRTTDHAVEVTYIDPDPTNPYPYYIEDDYSPFQKRLSKDYYIPVVINGVIEPILQPPFIPPVTSTPYPQSIWTKVWQAVFEWFRGH